jgi:predicted ATPase
MIIGVFLRYIKTYQGINYIPLTNGDSFCGLVGNNGVGKSSVLESLDCFFNARTWNYNITTKKSGLDSTNPYIVPVFLIQKDLLDNEAKDKAELLSSVIWDIEEKDIANANKPKLRNFLEQRNDIKQKINIHNYFLLPIGINHKGKVDLSIFNCKLVKETLFKDNLEQDNSGLSGDQLKELKTLVNKIRESIQYIYIPREIDPENFTQLETQEIQVLMGETLTEILEKKVTAQQIKDINNNLNEFIDNLSNELKTYSYRTLTQRQQNLRKSDLYNLIIEAFFRIRKLHKKQGEQWLEIGALSSGEKQKAIIDIAFNLLKHNNNSGKNLIIAVDEPESSLHMSACFDQFNALYEISRTSMQLLFASHWYGFLPVIEKGYVTIISKQKTEHQFDLFNLEKYREEIRQKISQSKGQLPYDIRLKSINDLVQSIVASTIDDNPYNWIICEGSSDKCYLVEYFKDIIDNNKLRIIPVGGASEIKRLYQHISLAYEDLKLEIKGKIVLLSDTDAQLVRYETQNPQNHPNLMCKRIVNCEIGGKTKLVKIDSNPVSPPTEIEDVLNGKLFYEALIDFKQKYPELLDFICEEKDISETSSYFALDLKPSEKDKLKQFFDRDNNKYMFASKYIERMNDTYAVPDWITKIRNFITSDK